MYINVYVYIYIYRERERDTNVHRGGIHHLRGGMSVGAIPESSSNQS